MYYQDSNEVTQSPKIDQQYVDRQIAIARQEGQKARGSEEFARASGYSIGGAIGQLTKPQSPIDAQLDAQAEMLIDLDDAVSALIDPLLSVMTHDPRNQKATAEGTQPCPPVSCSLEGGLINRNREITEQISRLREIRRLLCL